jgi:hypothetical protein
MRAGALTAQTCFLTRPYPQGHTHSLTSIQERCVCIPASVGFHPQLAAWKSEPPCVHQSRDSHDLLGETMYINRG